MSLRDEERPRRLARRWMPTLTRTGRRLHLVAVVAIEDARRDYRRIEIPYEPRRPRR